MAVTRPEFEALVLLYCCGTAAVVTVPELLLMKSLGLECRLASPCPLRINVAPLLRLPGAQKHTQMQCPCHIEKLDVGLMLYRKSNAHTRVVSGCKNGESLKRVLPLAQWSNILKCGFPLSHEALARRKAIP